MKGIHHPRNDVTINPSGNESIHDVIGRTDPGRRTFLKTAVSASVLASLGGVSLSGLVRAVEAAPVPAGRGFAGIGFESIPPSVIVAPATSIADEVRVPPGYKVEVLAVPKIRKSQAAHGVSVMEVRKNAGKWQVTRNSPYPRRITANTPMRVAGPSAGNDLLPRPEGARGTDQEIAHGHGPSGSDARAGR